MLAHSIVKYEDREPSAYMVFLHGILGTRANWRGIARRFVEGRPGWGVVLVDLREHGDSLGYAPPHTLEATATDLLELEKELGRPIAAALGHSFGGKVALEWLRARDKGAEVWLIDSSPGPKAEGSGITQRVLEILGELSPTWASREAFVQSVVDRGQPRGIAQWLAMNLHKNDDGTRSFGPDLRAIHAMIEDYARADYWPMIESLAPDSSLQVVIGGRSPMFSPEDTLRIKAIAERNARIAVHVFEESEHWVHIDATDDMVSLLIDAVGSQNS